MDLIEALEELSLEVKNKECNHETKFGVASSSGIGSHNDERSQQILDFDSSLNTLIDQINGLNNSEKRTWEMGSVSTCGSIQKGGQYLEEYPKLQSNRPQHQLSNKWRNQKIHYQNSSLETSQEEEDSDCSLSQQSDLEASPGSRRSQMNPLVRDLLAKDLSSITDTVRKIGSILALGKAIENMYHTMVEYNSHHSKLNDVQDLTYGMSICNHFQKLCETDGQLGNLPTIFHYNSCCQQLQAQIKLLTENNQRELQSSTKTANYNVNQHCLNQEPPLTTSIGHLEGGTMSEAIEECSQNWTENKLYVEHNKFQQT